MGRSQLICTGGSLMVTVPYSNDYKDDKNEEIEPSKETGCGAPEDPILCINDCDFFCSASTMNICSKCQKDVILLKKEHTKLATASSKDVVCRSTTSAESELALADVVVTFADLASQFHMNAGQNAIAKANPIIIVEKLNKIYKAPIERLYELKQCPSFYKLASSYRVTMKVLHGGRGGGYPRT
ncbi:Zinc finger A20 and AN1 domain-containing stress-associated protein 4 [Capsicum baccatum]|uniref:Zinc finger A20 and AN1 domain-containing stress-associated protein 4 n=1 Tax=Capsicum baccatum TaxID=33114 RepID=A0A2G2VCB1_CAPBA|nr:Zinc finger A20 and AN1 domain-containing stress-associated protein 4 [Capsicum baccatum]